VKTAMQRITLIFVAVLFCVAPSVHARDCSTSKQFQLKKPQVVFGVLQDPSGAELSGMQLDLLSGKNTVRHLRTDNFGKYDFGEAPAGKYRIRVQYGGDAFCAPKVLCQSEGCTFEQRLKVNSKDTVTVY